MLINREVAELLRVHEETTFALGFCEREGLLCVRRMRELEHEGVASAGAVRKLADLDQRLASVRCSAAGLVDQKASIERQLAGLWEVRK